MSATFRAFQDQQAREHNGRAWAAWHTAALSRIPPHKRLPSLKRLQQGVRREAPRRQTSAEQWAIMEQWARHMQRIEDRKKGSRR